MDRPPLHSSSPRIAQVRLVFVLGLGHVATCLGAFHIGLGLGLIDLVPDTFLGVVSPLSDRLVGSVGGVSW